MTDGLGVAVPSRLVNTRLKRSSAPLLAILALLGAAATAAGDTTSAYSSAADSPVETGTSPYAIAFSPSGALLAVANYGAADVSMFTANVLTGALTAAPGSPDAAGNGPVALAFNPAGTLLATANLADGSVSVFSVNPSTGALAAVGGSPFPAGDQPRALAFSPSGGLLAVANSADGTVSVLSVDGSGTLSQVPGSPVAVGGYPVAVAFSPDGSLLAVADEDDGTASVFTVSASGGLTAVSGSPFPVGEGPAALAFSPGGSLLAVADSVGNAVSVLSVGSGGTLAAVNGSPFATGDQPLALAFNNAGTTLAIAAGLDDDLSLFSVDGSGALAPLPGSPFAVGDSPHGVSISPGGGGVIAVADASDNDISLLAPAAPTATIASPQPGATFAMGQGVTTSYSCADSTFGPGIASCTQVTALSTATPGTHTYSVTATSLDGQSSTTTVAYTVIPSVPSVRVPPTLIGTGKSGDLLYCENGSWNAVPSSITYEWTRNGIPIQGANLSVYTIQPIDEGSTLDCTVTATNVVGSAAAQPPGMLVAAPSTRDCPKLVGEIVGDRLGAVRIGETGSQAQRALPHATFTERGGTAAFCGTPYVLEVAFAPSALLDQLSPAQQAALQNRIVLAMTASPLFGLSGIVSGMTLAAAEQKLGSAVVYSFGKTSVAFARRSGAAAVVVAARGVVTEIGVAASQLASDPSAALALVKTVVSRALNR